MSRSTALSTSLFLILYLQSYFIKCNTNCNLSYSFSYYSVIWALCQSQRGLSNLQRLPLDGTAVFAAPSPPLSSH